MCGICGWLNVNNRFDVDTFEKMNNIVRHRGPDDEGYIAISNRRIHNLAGKDSNKEILYDGYIQEYDANADGDFLLLGHRRLAIIDLSANGHQPMHLNKRLVITFNGEIYNYIEIRKELISKGYLFETDTDTEVILRAYEEWGENCVNRFNGMWSFAIWDKCAHKLFCSRDRLGAKPFYYWKDKEEFIFASEIKQLCENDNINRVLNEEYFNSQIMWGLSDYSEETMIKNIKSLRGGNNLIVTLNETDNQICDFKIYEYWDVDTVNKEEGIEEETFRILEDAIKIRTRSDVPIGVLLSGGLDSSCIVSEITEYYKELGISNHILNTFTSCYHNFKEGNEQNYASMVNKYCGVKENLYFPDAKETFQILEDMIWHLEGITDLQVIGSYLFLQEIAKTGVKVLINGQGSDETQFGYERYYAFYLRDLWRKNDIESFLRAFRNAKENSKMSFGLLIQYYIYFSSFYVRKFRCMQRMKKYITKDMQHVFWNNHHVDQFVKINNMQQLQYNELRNTQLTHILRMDDRLYMSQSLESRVPYIDYRYIEKAVKIPEKEKIQEGYTKYLLRKHFENRLPEEVVWRKNKMGWPSPKKRWAERLDKNKVEELFRTARTSKYFNVEKIKKLYYKDATAYPFVQFIMTEMFVRKFRVDIP